MKHTLSIVGAVAASVVVAGVLGYPQQAQSQSSATRTFIPLGTHGAGLNNLSSYAWFIDANDRKVILCLQAPAAASSPTAAPVSPPPKVSCTSTPLP